MLKEYTCIVCPQGCDIEIEFDEQTGIINELSGAKCPKGKNYVEEEIIYPKRTLQSSVRVINGSLPLVSVKTSDRFPKEKIMMIMKVINELEVNAPIEIGDVLVNNVCNLNVDIIATKNICQSSEK